MVYQSGRGNKTGGVQNISTWRNIILSTGEDTIINVNTPTGALNRVVEIEGSPFESEEKASKIYSLIQENYGTAGRVFINKLISEFSEDNYDGLKTYYGGIVKKIGENSENKSNTHISAISIVVLSDILIGKYLFKEDLEGSLKMGIDILKNILISKDINKTERCYEYTKGWLISNYKLFDRYRGGSNFNGINDEEDVYSCSYSNSSYGIYENGIYYILTNIFDDLLTRKGYSYRTILSGFGKRNYIITKNQDNGLVENTIQKKYRGVNTRMIGFIMNPLKIEDYRKKEEEYDYLVRGTTREQEEKIIEMVASV
jgi:putative DNA primase/helicase